MRLAYCIVAVAVITGILVLFGLAYLSLGIWLLGYLVDVGRRAF